MPLSIRPFRSFPMGFASLIMLLLLSNGLAYAEWVKIDTSDDGMITYVDPDSIRRKGDLVKMWALFDLKIVDTFRGHSYLSAREQKVYDCAEERARSLAGSFHSGNMGSGKVVFNTDEDK